MLEEDHHRDHVLPDSWLVSEVLSIATSASGALRRLDGLEDVLSPTRGQEQ